MNIIHTTYYSKKNTKRASVLGVFMRGTEGEREKKIEGVGALGLAEIPPYI